MISYWILALYLCVLCLGGFFLCAHDKKAARLKHWRTPERRFFIFAALGGGLGVFAGMLTFHHKTKHWYFMVFIPLLTLANGLLLWWLQHTFSLFS